MGRSVKQSPSAMTLVDHIRELRMRLFVTLVVLVLAGAGIYFLYEPILAILRSPLNAPLYYNNPAGSFAFVMKICFMGALVITIPVIVYNLTMFIRPAFEKAIPKWHIYIVSVISAILAGTGAVFGYLFIIPGALRFFAGFQVEGLSALISADNYLNFVTNVIITFILIFQLPLMLTFIDRIKPLSPKSLFGAEKWVILSSLVISLLVPFALDLTTSILIALPIVILYNISIVIILAQHAYIAHREKAIQRVRFDITSMPESTLSLSNLSFEKLFNELPEPSESIITKPPIAYQTRPSKGRPGMDIRPSKSPAPIVQPAPWVHRVHAPIALNERVKIISDIRPQAPGNRATA